MDTLQIQARLGDIRNIMGQQSNNEIIKQTLDIWSKMVKEYNMEGDIKLLIWPTLDPKFKPGISDAGFRGWWGNGITAVCTLTHRALVNYKRNSDKDFFR